MAKPRELALGVMAGVLLGLLDRLGQGNRTFEMPDQPRHAMRFHGRQQGIEAALPQRARFVERAGLHHEFEAEVDPAVQRVALGREEDLHDARRVEQRRQPVAMPSGDRPPGRLHDLQGARNADAVRGTQTGGRQWIQPCQFGMERRHTRCFEPRPHGGPNLRRHRRDRREATCQGLEIEPAAAGKDCQPPVAARPRERHGGIFDEATDRIILRGIDMAVKQVRRPREVAKPRPRRDDVKVAIDLHGVRIDDNAIDFLGQRKRECRLAARGRPCDKHRLQSANRSAVHAMTHVATLIANPSRPMADDIVARAIGVLPGSGRTEWLEPGLAVDIPFTPGGENRNRDFADRVRAKLEGAPVDVVVQATAGRRKRLFLADMDSTMIGQECVDELADFVGKKAHVAAITERAMRGEIEFAPALRERVALLAGLSADVVDKVVATRITLMPGARTLVHTMRRHGAHTCLVSGGFTVFTSRIAALIGFDENRGNELVLGPDRRFSGRVAEPVLGRDAKLETLVELRQRFGLEKHATLVAGDGANDLLMIDDAGLGVAYHAKPLVAAAAGARIDYGDLTALLYAQGYRRNEFVEA